VAITQDAATRAFLQRLTREQLFEEIESCEKFAARLATERRQDELTDVQIANNRRALEIAYQILNGA
jgi:hypothetical protein